MPDLIGLLIRLVDAGFEFVLVGGYAVMTHGASLMTQDVDVCADFKAINLLRLNTALAGLRPVHRMTPQRLPLTLDVQGCRGLKNLYLGTDWGQLDILSEITAVGAFDKVLAHSVQIELRGRPVNILNLDALIAAKAAMNRPRDKEAVLQLKAIQELKEDRR